jgi:hypothetical protein
LRASWSGSGSWHAARRALQGLQGLIGASFLPEADRGIKHGDEHDDERVKPGRRSVPTEPPAASSVKIMKSLS